MPNVLSRDKKAETYVVTTSNELQKVIDSPHSGMGRWTDPRGRGSNSRLALAPRFGNLPIRDVKQRKKIALGSSDSTTAAADFTYSMQGKVISITYLGTGSIREEIGRILRRIEHWHQSPVTSYRILYQDAAGLGGEVKWDGENAEAIGV